MDHVFENSHLIEGRRWVRLPTARAGSGAAPSLPGIYVYGEVFGVLGLPVELRWMYVGRSGDLRRRFSDHEGYRELEMLDVENLSGAMLKRKVAVSSRMEADAVPLVLEAGQLSIHDSFLIHGSSPNHSDRRPRRLHHPLWQCLDDDNRPDATYLRRSFAAARLLRPWRRRRVA